MFNQAFIPSASVAVVEDPVRRDVYADTRMDAEISRYEATESIGRSTARESLSFAFNRRTKRHFKRKDPSSNELSRFPEINGRRSAPHPEFPSISLDVQFRWLADEWLEDQGGRSRVNYHHPSFQKIIKMGKLAVPLILNEVRLRSGHWFEALRLIVGATPVPPESRGSFEGARNAWLRWGIENGYGRMEDREGKLDAVTIA